MIKQKLKVVHFPRWFPNSVDSSSGIFVLNHIRSTVPFADNTVVFADFYSNNFTEKYTEENIHFYKKNIPSTITRIGIIDTLIKNFNLFYFQWKSFKKIYTENGKPDLIHIHVLTRVAIIPFIISNWYQIPYIITEHWSRYMPEDNSFKGILRKKITQIIIQNAKSIMPVSKALQNGMQRFNLNGKYKIIPNVVNTEIFCLKTKAKNENTKLLFVGSLLDEVKNVSQILKVFHTILQQNKDIHLSIIGNGIDRPKHETFVLQNNMNENVSFLGKFSQNDVANEMSKHDFLVLFSNFENLPCVLLEAMSCGLPVIAPNVGGVGEIVNEQNGILVNKNDIEAFKNAILKMQKTHQLYNKERLHNYIQRNYSVQAISEKLKKVYFSAINNV